MLNKTIVRHGSEVQTLRLKHVGLTTPQYKTIDVNMSKCSVWMVGHDKSKGMDVNRPAPNDVLADIETLNTFVGECKEVGETLRKERDTALKPEASPIG